MKPSYVIASLVCLVLSVCWFAAPSRAKAASTLPGVNSAGPTHMAAAPAPAVEDKKKDDDDDAKGPKDKTKKSKKDKYKDDDHDDNDNGKGNDDKDHGPNK